MELGDLDQDFTDLTRVNVSDDQGPTRSIYRLDLDADYVAYYEIDIGSNYVMLSSDQKTGHFREVARIQDQPIPTKSDWATTEVVLQGDKKKKTEADEEALSPGSIVKLALGERFKSVNVYRANSGHGGSRMRPSSRATWQRKLCKVLVDVCLPDGRIKINPSAIKEATNHLLFLKLEVNGNRTFVGNVLQWREIGFVVEIKGLKNEVLKKHLQSIYIPNGSSALQPKDQFRWNPNFLTTINICVVVVVTVDVVL
ncbi:hypothetical protein ACROYT_G000641 [Oculina patagonica]